MADDAKQTEAGLPQPRPATPPVAPLPALTYERPPAGAVSRWHVRWVLLLATVYLMVTLQNTYLPDVRATIKDWWASRQEAAAKADNLKQARAFERRLMEFADPPT